MDFSDLLPKILLGSLAVTGILCGSVFFFHPVKDVLVWNPVGDTVIRWFAYASAILVILGLLCIFWKAVRIPTAIVLGVYFMLFLNACVLIKIHESLDYKIHGNDRPQPRYGTITKHKEEWTNQGTTVYLNILIDGEKREWEFSDNRELLPFFDNVAQDDRARAQCIQGGLGTVYIVSLKRDMPLTNPYESEPSELAESATDE